ncbi:MAG: HAMP domain-containing histidine kinase [Gammaproteobacteria bacterium]|nr:HAMP domain-containing histidine kinase [Gammaproteobacteria bacterium]
MTDLRRLRVVLALFFLALAVPTAALIREAYQRLQWESFHQHQLLAEEFTARVEQRLAELMAVEDARPFTEYSYFNLVLPHSGAVLQRSPLANLPPANAVPGLVGHFQVDEQGALSVPFEPPADSDTLQTGLSADERRARQALAARLRDILASNRLLGAAPTLAKDVEKRAQTRLAPMDVGAYAPRPAPDTRSDQAQQEFDKLNAPKAAAPGAGAAPSSQSLGRVADLKLEQNFQGAPVMAEAASADAASTAPARQALRKERSALPALSDESKQKKHGRNAQGKDGARIHTFESEIDRFNSSLLASGELVLFRNGWRDGQRYVQGLVIDREQFLKTLVSTPFRASALAGSSRLVVARHGEVLLRADGDTARDYGRATTLRGTLLYQGRLSAPFNDFELIFSVTELPAGPGTKVIGWLALVLALVLGGGLWLALRLGTRQLALARQQQDFIAAVSHELKTPLTSIRMYGEMLREGWAPEGKRQEYYQFIHDEAERLTRLINNVLNLARMTRNELKVDLREVTVGELMDLVRSKLESVVQHAARRYSLDCPTALHAARVEVDLDCFTQVLLNLVDNALKFTDTGSGADSAIEVAVRAGDAHHVEFTVRDFGPGIAKEQMSRIFALFYRGENALTRATAGTGIGLALVKRLVEVMGGEVTVTNREPGAEFCVRLPRRDN